MTQENLNTLGSSIEEGEVAIIVGAILAAALFPGEFPNPDCAQVGAVTSYRDGSNIVVKVGDDIAAQFTPNERAQGEAESTYTVSGNPRIKAMLLELGMVEEPAEGPGVGTSDSVEDPTPDA